MQTLAELINEDDIRAIEGLGTVRQQATHSALPHRFTYDVDPRLGVYVALVRQRLGIEDDASVDSMLRAKVPSAGDIVEHLASRGVDRFALNRPRSWRASRLAVRELEEQ